MLFKKIWNNANFFSGRICYYLSTKYIKQSVERLIVYLFAKISFTPNG